MYRKNCYKCHRPSFSSCNTGEWICPICGSDLSNQKSFDVESVIGRGEERVKKENYYYKNDNVFKYNLKI